MKQVIGQIVDQSIADRNVILFFAKENSSGYFSLGALNPSNQLYSQANKTVHFEPTPESTLYILSVPSNWWQSE
jgi:hypothetical protein